MDHWLYVLSDMNLILASLLACTQLFRRVWLEFEGGLVMALVPRLHWRGRVRGLLQDLNTDLRSLLSYNGRHQGDPVLSPAEASQVAAVLAIVQAKLAQAVLR